MSCGWGRGHSEFGTAQKFRTPLPPLSCRMTSEQKAEICTIQQGKHLFESTNLPPNQMWDRQVLWESQFLGRLIRSLGSPRKRKGSGALKEEMGSGIFKKEENTSIFLFFSTFLTLGHIICFFSLSPELIIAQQITQFKLYTELRNKNVSCLRIVFPSWKPSD